METADSSSGSDHKGKFYFYWGYNGSAFTNSNIHFGGPDYDFTVQDVVAHDRPSPFSLSLYFNPATVSIPQYNYRIGYFLTDRWSISIGLDHMKYVMDQNQTALVTGTIDDEAGGIYAGIYDHTPVVLTEDFLKFEHTDGLNLLSADAEYTASLFTFLHDKISLSVSSGIGFAATIPRTDVRVFGDGINNKFHLAGYGISAKSGARLEFFKNFFLLLQLRSGYINLPDILLNDNVPQRANQHFFFLEYALTAGITFPFHKHS
ncbi:MAG: hypothetical protein K1X61_05180 [Chitinophagales bacterium]|nr:hypothetical protein [Chitinophagales bacterium]